ncbi:MULTISPECIES: hypothetical protein [unclassified Bartonella]
MRINAILRDAMLRSMR